MSGSSSGSGGVTGVNSRTNGGLAAVLRALELPDIPLPTVGDTAAVAEAGTLAFHQVNRVIDALQLPGPQADAVLGAVEAATLELPKCHRFVGMRYKQLRRACLEGSEARVRKWVQVLAGGRSCGEGSGSNADNNGGVAADVLRALALPNIEPPAAKGEGDTAAVAAAHASTEVFAQVERVVDALQLPGEQLDDVRAAVEAATERPEQCHRFVGVTYRRLQRACQEGDEGSVRKQLQELVTGRNGL